MKNTKYIILLILLITGVSSCKKTVDDTVNGFVAGRDDKPISGAKVTIYSKNSNSNGTSYPSKLFSGVTDGDGSFDAGKMLQGQYYYTVSIEDGKKTYFDGSDFQKIEGDSKTILSKPFRNTGSLKLRIENVNSSPYANVNVVIVSHPAYSGTDYYFDDLMNDAILEGVTDSNGFVTFDDVPSGKEYSIMAYYSSNNFDFPKTNNFVYSGSTTKSYTIEVHL